MTNVKAKDKKDHILDVAEVLFANQGFDAVSVRDISKSAEINLAMISYYFGSKEKLYEAIINRKLITDENIRLEVDNLDSYEDKIFFFFFLYIKQSFENRKFQNIIFREMSLNQRTLMADSIANQIHKNFSLITEIIRMGITKKEFRNVDIELTVMSIIGIIKMYTTSGSMACKFTHAANSKEAYNTEHKTRLKKHLRELLTNHLILKK